MKISSCRSCKSKKIKKAFSLGSQSLTGVFPSSKTTFVPKGNLSMIFCTNCSLMQLENSFDPEEMYGENYGYMSSLNQSMFDHLKNKVANLKKKINLSYRDIVIDIGSNDGTFLSFFDKKYDLIGIDPTIKKFSKKYPKHIIKVPEFFSEKALTKYLTKKKAKLITSIAMFYDLEDPIKFTKEIYNCLEDNGVWHFEQSYMPSMIKNLSYDTICHEHLEYYSLKSVKYILDQVGFKIIDIELNNVNGGSFALTVAKSKSKFNSKDELINWLLKKEEIFNYNSFNRFTKFYKDILIQKKLLVSLLKNLKDMKKKVFGYGASTKGNVILQYCGIKKDTIPLIGEVNSFKYNKYTPGSKIKIIPEKKLKSLNPDYLLVLPWHFRDFIIKKEKDYLKKGGKLIMPLPDIEII